MLESIFFIAYGIMAVFAGYSLSESQHKQTIKEYKDAYFKDALKRAAMEREYKWLKDECGERVHN